MKFPKKFIVAFCILAVGVLGLILCVAPYYGPEKVVYNYIKAAQNGNVEKMLDCTIASEITDSLGASNLSGLLTQGATATISDSLIASVLNIPADAVQVEKVRVLGCSKELATDLSGIGYKVTVLIKTVYTTTEGEERTVVSTEGFSLINAGDGYKIYG